jgi:photosystem II stability/assembly factor-like uncharacterized protein
VRHPRIHDWLVASHGGGPGLVRSFDSGATWRIIQGSEAVAPGIFPATLAFSADGRYLFVSSGNPIYRSADNGETWQVVLSNDQIVGCSPVDPMRCLAREHVTADAGATWVPIAFPPAGPIWTAAFSTSEPSTVYAVRFGFGQLIVSNDGGLSFSSAPAEGFFELSVPVWVSPSDARVIVLARDGDLVRSVDAGQTFQVLATRLLSDVAGPIMMAADSGFDGISNQRVFVATRFGVFTTENLSSAGPGDWTARNEGLGGAQWSQIGPLSPETMLLIGNGELAVVSEAAPAPQRVLTRAQSGGGLERYTLDVNGPYVYGTVGARLVRTEIPTGTVQDLPLPEHGFITSVLAASGNVLFVASSRRLFRTLDARSPAPQWTLVHEYPSGAGGTAYFVSLRFPLPQSQIVQFESLIAPPAHCCTTVVGIIIDAAGLSPSLGTITGSHLNGGIGFTVASPDARVLYRRLTVFNGGPVTHARSDDGGATWTALAVPDAVSLPLTHPRNPYWVFVVGSDGLLYRSDDGGTMWTSSPRPPPGTGISGLSWWGTRLLSNWHVFDVPGRPSMSIDEPATTGTVRQPFRIAGWAVDPADATGTGIDAVQGYAYPAPGSGLPPIFLGTARYGDARPDVASAFGDGRFEPSGFDLRVDGLASGRYEFVVYQHSTFDGRFIGSTFTVEVTDGPISVEPLVMRFGAVRSGSTGSVTTATAAQRATVRFRSTVQSWTASADVAWLHVDTASGGGNAFTVDLSGPLPPTPSTTTLGATITVTPTGGLPVVRIPVTLVVYPHAATQPAFGQIDTPSQGAVNVSGAIGVTGWALDDVDVTSVSVYRECLSFDPPTICQSIDGRLLVFIGNAVRQPGARPDVPAAYPGFPAGHLAGWGMQVLTRMLPDVVRQQPFGGQGPLTLYAIATDAEGHRTFLGRSAADQTPTQILMDNDNGARPFGVIDTPAHGATVSGVIAISGWVLTPDDDTRADGTDIIVSPGASLTLFVDGSAIANSDYGFCRGTAGPVLAAGAFCDDDVASAFGHPTPMPPFTPRTANPTRFRNLDSGRGAIASMAWDSATVPNGLHSIAWSVTDSAGRVEGIGSRTINVANVRGAIRYSY